MTAPTDGIPEDLRRRLDRLEQVQAELQNLFRDVAMTNARINDSLLDLRGDIRDFRDELKTLREFERDLTSIKGALSLLKWVSATIVGTALTGAVAFLMNKFGLNSP